MRINRVKLLNKRKLNLKWLYSIPIEKRLSVLKRYNRVNQGMFVSPKKIASLRQEFSFIKDELLPIRVGTKCYTCDGQARERHHVLPLFSGGDNMKENLVPLCINCHKKVTNSQFTEKFNKFYHTKTVQKIPNEIKRFLWETKPGALSNVEKVTFVNL